MDIKEIKIIVPEGYEIDKENSTFECIKLKPKQLTYEDIAKELFSNKNNYYISNCGAISCQYCFGEANTTNPNNVTSKKQLEKLLALNKLMNVAKYLNGDWKPDWCDEHEKKWIITIVSNNTIKADDCYVRCYAGIYFKTKELAFQAIEILGEEIIRLALLTDW